LIVGAGPSSCIDYKLRLLNSFGPSMILAREMLEAGERETVLEYLRLCRSFWKADEGRLERWTQEIKAGRTPDFGPSLKP
jgi:hypothetical protein